MDLLEAGARRAAFLERATARLGLADRVTVLHERAEVCGRETGCRGCYDGVLARSFGRPAVVAECAAPLLKVGGWLVVSEPPAAGEPAGASRLPVAGGAPGPARPRSRPRPSTGSSTTGSCGRWRVCPERFPRRNGVPAKKPLF